MTAPLNTIIDHLSTLVGFDTQNPPRLISVDHPIFAYLSEALPGFYFKVSDLGNGCVNFLATRGKTDRIFNIHLDTVPASEAWTQDPFSLTITDEKCIGLGACDIKGAVAALITAANNTDRPAAFLFTTDEEAGKGKCVSTFLKTNKIYKQAIIGEPTSAKAVLQHRGVLSAEVSFTGKAAHASNGPAENDNAIHKSVEWASSALAFANNNSHNDDFRLNLGVIEGGIKPNVSAASCHLKLGMRPPVGLSPEEALALFLNHQDKSPADSHIRFSGPALPANSLEESNFSYKAAEDFANGSDLDIGPPVDFWTEASLFSQHGIPSIVLGPGDIAQAHTADEWVMKSDLMKTYLAYEGLLHHAE